MAEPWPDWVQRDATLAEPLATLDAAGMWLEEQSAGDFLYEWPSNRQVNAVADPLVSPTGAGSFELARTDISPLGVVLLTHNLANPRRMLAAHRGTVAVHLEKALSSLKDVWGAGWFT